MRSLKNIMLPESDLRDAFAIDATISAIRQFNLRGRGNCFAVVFQLRGLFAFTNSG